MNSISLSKEVKEGLTYVPGRVIDAVADAVDGDEVDEMCDSGGVGRHQRPDQGQRQHGVRHEDDEQDVPHHVRHLEVAHPVTGHS